MSRNLTLPRYLRLMFDVVLTDVRLDEDRRVRLGNAVCAPDGEAGAAPKAAQA